MASPAFFNENENRAYPLVLSLTGLPPNALLVDCGFVVYAKSRFELSEHMIVLNAIRRQGTFIYLDFTSDAPELFGVPLVFSRQIGDGDFVTEFVDSGTAGLSESSESGSNSDSELCVEALWSGFVTTGRLAAFEALLPVDGEIAYNVPIEPSLIQNLAEAYVAKFGVANADRTRVTPASGCGAAVEANDTIFVKDACVRGDVVFRAGYNANVRQSEQDNSITLGASVGDGEGQPCAPIVLYSGEVAPDGSLLLEGGLKCNETLRAINGIGGPLFTFIAGPGVNVTAVPEENKIIVNVSMSGLAICFNSISYRSESC